MQLTQITPRASSHNPSVFKFGRNEIRVFEKDREPWFLAADVCKALELTNPTASLKVLAPSEKNKIDIGRPEKANVISESGLYVLILRCQDAIKEGSIAYEFRIWVTKEVLPAIRKTGQYSTVRENRTVVTITPEQQFELKEAVKRKAKTAPTHYQTIYRAIYARYKIARYDQLPASMLADCIAFINTIDLRVPEVPKAPEPFQETEAVPMQPKRDILTRLECERLLGFVYEFKYLHKRDLDAIYDLLKAVHSPLAASFWELKESWSIGNLERVLAAHGYRVQDLDCYKHLMGLTKQWKC